jgi:hypothetical protein
MDTCKHLLFPGDIGRLQRNLKHFAKAFNAKMGLRPSDVLACLGLLDGTAREISRPTGAYHYQRSVYDGHHRFHGFDYQAVMTPDGIIWQLFGPVSARHTDSWMVNESKLLELIRDFCWDDEGKQYFVYADQGYISSPFLLCPFPVPTELQQRVNGAWARLRIGIEWEFGRIVALFQSLDQTRLQKALKSLVGLWYPVCVLLTNCLNCMYGCEVSQYFSCPAPELEEYLSPPAAAYPEWLAQFRPDPRNMHLYGDEGFEEHLHAEKRRRQQHDACMLEIKERRVV